MPNYVFHNCCSPREFEEFVRDVLEVELAWTIKFQVKE